METRHLSTSCTQFESNNGVFTDHISGPGRALGRLCVRKTTFELSDTSDLDIWHVGSARSYLAQEARSRL